MNTKKIVNIIDYILAIMIIMNCNTVFERSINVNFHIQELGCIFVYVSIIMLGALFGLNRSTIFKWLKIMIWYIPLVGIYFVFRNKIMMKTTYIHLFFLFFPGILLYVYLESKKNLRMNLYKSIADIMFVVGGISSVVWFLSNIIGVLHPSGKMIVNWGGERIYESFWGIHYQIAWQSIKIFGLTGYRNISFFCEAPSLSLMLTFALIYELYFREEQKSAIKIRFKNILGKYEKTLEKQECFRLIRVIVLVLSNVTTFSATGYILMIVAFILKYVRTDKINRRNIIKKLAFPIIIIIAGSLIYVVWNQKADSPQWLTRFDDYIVGISAWKSNKILGVGFGNVDALIPYMSTFRSSNTGISSGLFAVLAQGGIILALVYLFPLIGGIVCTGVQKKKNMCAFLMLATIEFIVTYFSYTFLMLLILAYGYLAIDSEQQL